MKKILFIYLIIQTILGFGQLIAQTSDINTYYVEHRYRDTSVIQIRTCDDNVIDNLCTEEIIDSNNVFVYVVRDIFTKEDVCWYEFNFPIDMRVQAASCLMHLSYDELVSYPVRHRFKNFKKQ